MPMVCNKAGELGQRLRKGFAGGAILPESALPLLHMLVF